VAPQIRDDGSWHAVWLGLAQRAEADKRWLDAALDSHSAACYLPTADVRNGLYDDFARHGARGLQDVAGYARIAVPYPGGPLPGFRVRATGQELSTFIFHGGYDSSVEEFYAFRLPLTDLGFSVIGFDGPGQGGALRQGSSFEHAWEKPAQAVLDYCKLDAVDWLGVSCGGYLSIRAALHRARGGGAALPGRPFGACARGARPPAGGSPCSEGNPAVRAVKNVTTTIPVVMPFRPGHQLEDRRGTRHHDSADHLLSSDQGDPIASRGGRGRVCASWLKT
jgi:hypothetical protein